MSLNIIVLAKQVPDTRNVGKDAMKEDGTINRAALPAIFNPEDLNALEQALRLKETHPGSTITLLTMGLPRAAEIVREAIYRGADSGIVLTDRALGGADTLATSYSLAQAVKKIGDYDIILAAARLSTAIPHRSVPRLPKNSVSRKLPMPRRYSKSQTEKLPCAVVSKTVWRPLWLPCLV